MRRSLRTLAPALCVIGACSDDGGTGPGTPTVDVEVTRQLVAELTSEWMSSLAYAGLNSQPSEPPSLGFALQLAGTDEGLLGAGTLFPGAPIGVADPFCDSQVPGGASGPFWEARDTCRRFSKISETSYAVEVYFTVQPVTMPDEPHAFEYEATDPSGTVTYDPNPLVTWNHDLSGPDGPVLVTAELDISVTYQDDEGASVDLSHTGNAEANFDQVNGTSVLLLDLEFANVSDLCAETMIVEVVDDNEDVSGSVTCGGSELATVTHDASGFVFTWN